mgnify:FL=1
MVNGLLDILGKTAIIANDAAKEYKHPGYLNQKRSLDLEEREINRRERASRLNEKIEFLKQLEPGSEAFYAALEGISNDPAFVELKQRIQGKNMKASGAPYGVSDDKMAEYNNAMIQESINRARQTTTKPIQDRFTGKWYNVDRITGEMTPINLNTNEGEISYDTKPNQTLADMLAGEPQETTRKGWWIFGDDTINPSAVKLAAKKRMQDLQYYNKLSPDEARQQVILEYNTLKEKENNDWFKRYPDNLDLAQYFIDEDIRQQAIQNNNVVVDTGDGIQTTKPQMQDLGITDSPTQEHFKKLENIVNKKIPGFDLRKDYTQDMEFYTQLFKVMEEGVSDGKGGKRPITEEEIIRLITGN